MNQTCQEPAAVVEKIRIVLQTPEIRVVEYVLQPGDRHPWHHHSEVTDRFYCLEGQIEVELRDPPRTEQLRPGQTLTIPPQVVHRKRSSAALWITP